MAEYTTATYRARTRGQAAELMAMDATRRADKGFVLADQAWAPPQLWRVFITPPVLLVAGYLILGLNGAAIGAIVAIVYVLAFRPKGLLTVTYQRG